MEIIRILMLLFYTGLFGLAAAINFRNAIHHRERQEARILYRAFIGTISLIASISSVLIISGIVPSPTPILLGFLVISGLGVCVVVIGAVEW